MHLKEIYLCLFCIPFHSPPICPNILGHLSLKVPEENLKFWSCQSQTVKDKFCGKAMYFFVFIKTVIKPKHFSFLWLRKSTKEQQQKNWSGQKWCWEENRTVSAGYLQPSGRWASVKLIWIKGSYSAFMWPTAPGRALQIGGGEGWASLGTWAGKANRLRGTIFYFLNTCNNSRSNAEILCPAQAHIFGGRSWNNWKGFGREPRL